jgi:hypothetical protein
MRGSTHTSVQEDNGNNQQDEEMMTTDYKRINEDFLDDQQLVV